MGVSKFPSAVRERSVQLVLEQVAQHKTEWSAIASVAEKIGCTGETRQYERDGCRREGPTSLEKERIKVLERENKELRLASATEPARSGNS